MFEISQWQWLVGALTFLCFFTSSNAWRIPASGGAFHSQLVLTDLPGQGEQSFEIANHPTIENHQLRLSEPDICDTSVKQYSGYLDISDSKHLFFWFFEARKDPENAPLMLWINGGPGSSTIGSGLLFEHGPCFLNGTDTVTNKHSWNEKLNIIYLDEPVGTGYSYAEGDEIVSTLKDLAADVHAFLQLFFYRFPQYASLPFHIGAESWGGHYGPHIASHVHQQNKGLDLAPRAGQVRINLASLVLANGLTDPLTQFSTIEKYLCGGAPYPPYKSSDKTCIAVRLGMPACLKMIEACYNHESVAICRTATMYCWPGLFTAPLVASGKNPYDLRKDCPFNRNNSLCYDDLDDISTFLNSTKTKKALGVDPKHNFALTNETVNQAFYNTGQALHNSAALLPELVNSGIRLMTYAGDVDGVCNYQGIELWMERLDHRFHLEFEVASNNPWRTSESGYFAGTVRKAGEGAGNVTAVRVFNAGHLAPHDQPEASLDMISRWVDNMPF